MIYTITATVEKKTKSGWNIMQIPTFYLDGSVQGIMNEDHARFIGAEIINPLRLKNIKVNVSAVAVRN